MMVGQGEGAVQLCSFQELFYKLCESVLSHSLFQTSSSILDLSFRQTFVDREKLPLLAKKLRLRCMDVVLLRKWEWMGTETTHCITDALGFTLDLYCHGEPLRAKKLTSAVHWMLGDASELMESESILQFLCLLSSPKISKGTCGPTTRGDHIIYRHYPSTVFEQPLEPDDATMEASVDATFKLFNSLPGSTFACFSTKILPEDDLLKHKLFGGLTHSTSSDLNDSLGLPLLPSDHTHLSLLPTPSHNRDLTPPTTTPLVFAPTSLPCNSLLLAMATKQMSLLRSWEGWNTSTPFLCDSGPPAPAHATILLTSDYANLAGVPTPPLSDPLLLPQLLQTTVDNLPYSAPPPVIGTDTVLFALTHSLKSLLISCRAGLQSPGPSLIQREQDTHHIVSVTRFVVDLMEKSWSLEKYEMMNALFCQSLQLQATPHYFLFLSLLSQSLLSYLKLVEQWVFYGIMDPEQWIGIESDETALGKKDELYWTHGYTAPLGCSPPFLSHLNHPILACGKALNLLHQCQPQHPLCSGQFSWPNLKLAFTSQQLIEIEAQSQAYQSEVTSVCLAMSEKIRLERLAEKERELTALAQARQEARDGARRVREFERKQLLADLQKKRLLASELKGQMEMKWALRSKQLQEDRLSDLAMTQVQSREEIWLKGEARQELEMAYEQLCNKAEDRKLRAQWRLARLKLASRREELWRQESSRWEEEAADWEKRVEGGVGTDLRRKEEGEKEIIAPKEEEEEAVTPKEGEKGAIGVKKTEEGEGVAINLKSEERGLEENVKVESSQDADSSVTKATLPQPASVTNEAFAPLKEAREPHLGSTRGHAPPTTNQYLLQDVGGSYQDVGAPRLISSRGHAPPSTIQYLLQDADGLFSGYQDVGAPRLISSRGHAPPSTIQRLFWGDKLATKSEPVPATHKDREIEIKIAQASSNFSTKNFSVLDEKSHLHDMLANIASSSHGAQVDLEFLSLFPLTSLLSHSIETPLHTQCSLVNQSLLDYLITHCQLHQHFFTLKRFLLLEDGEFSHTLSTKLCEELSSVSHWKALCSPLFLNSLLLSALECSLHRHSVEASKLSFALKYHPQNLHLNAVKALDFLQLKYKVEWPCNIVITPSSLHRYNQIWQFLLEMKRSTWLLKQTFHSLKDCEVLDELRIRQLQTYRHEFQHFVNTMHGYISNQLFGVTWEEFQVELTQQTRSLDDVIMAHNKFIDKALFRCLLSKKAKPVMNLIYDLLSSIITFSSQVNEGSCGGFSRHSYAAVCHTCKGFRDTVRLLINVLGKLIARGYQPHLEELLLRLNFNAFYLH